MIICEDADRKLIFMHTHIIDFSFFFKLTMLSVLHTEPSSQMQHRIVLLDREHLFMPKSTMNSLLVVLNWQIIALLEIRLVQIQNKGHK